MVFRKRPKTWRLITLGPNILAGSQVHGCDLPSIEWSVPDGTIVQCLLCNTYYKLARIYHPEPGKSRREWVPVEYSHEPISPQGGAS